MIPGAFQSFISVYLMFGLSLLFFSGYIYLQISSDIMKDSEHTGFKLFIIAFQIYVILANVQTLEEYGIIRLSVPLYKGALFAQFFALLLTSFCYYAVTVRHYALGLGNSVKRLIIGAALLMFSVILLTVSLFNGFIFYVDKNMQSAKGPCFYLLHLIVGIYLFLIVKTMLYGIRGREIVHSNKRIISTVLFIAFITLWVVFDDRLKGMTVLPIAFFAVIFYSFVSSQQENIYTDALTGMNNRRRAEIFLNEQIKNSSEEEPVYLFMGDINGFKQINDRYGHYEGDCALMIFSDAVKKSAAAYNGFAARYGGDEFVWAWKPVKSGDVDPEMVINDIRHRVEAECKTQKRPYIMSLSIGFILCTDPKMRVFQYLKQADRKMYADKEGYYRTSRRKH